MDRVKVEGQEIEQRRTKQGDGQSPDDHRDAVDLEKAVDRRQRLVADAFRLARGLNSVSKAGSNVILVT